MDARTGQKSSELSRAQQDWAAQGRTGQGGTEQGRVKQGWAGLDKTGQAGLGRGESIAGQGLGLWKALMKKENALWSQQSLETAFPKLIFLEFQEAACPVSIPF